MSADVLALSMPGTGEWVVILVVALLIFGRRMPEVARSLGKSIVEFKRGIKDVQTEIDLQSRLEAPPLRPKLDQQPDSLQTPLGRPEGRTAPNATGSEGMSAKAD